MKGSLKSIDGARKKRKSVESEVTKLALQVNDLEESLAKSNAQMKELMRANNAASLLLATMEQFLDERFEGWDGGKREVFKEKAVLLAERQELMISLSKALEVDEREVAAERLFGISRQLGSEGQDIPVVISSFVKTRNFDRALELISFTRTTKIQIAPEYAELFKQLEDRVDKLRKEYEEAKES